MADSAQQDGPLDRKVALPQLDLIVQGIQALPPVNAGLSRAPELIPAAEEEYPPRDDEQSARFVELLASDPAATARLLSVANQASPKDIVTVSQAIEGAGFHIARSAVLCCLALRPADGGPEKGGLNRRDFWHHCLAVAVAARMLTEQAGLPFEPAEAFTWGLLHDLGRSQGHNLRHGIEGYLLAQAEGYQEEGRICLIHILKGHTLHHAVSLGMLTGEEVVQLEEDGWRSGNPSLEEKIAT